MHFSTVATKQELLMIYLEFKLIEANQYMTKNTALQGFLSKVKDLFEKFYTFYINRKICILLVFSIYMVIMEKLYKRFKTTGDNKNSNS